MALAVICLLGHGLGTVYELGNKGGKSNFLFSSSDLVLYYTGLNEQSGEREKEAEKNQKARLLI